MSPWELEDHNLQGRPREELMFSLESNGSLEAEFLPLLGASLFCLKAFSWLDETTHTMEGDLLYSESTDLNVNHI